jgi:hypothetical protein
MCESGYHFVVIINQVPIRVRIDCYYEIMLLLVDSEWGAPRLRHRGRAWY